ncbi:pyrroloquinoline quinone biosynthesis protein PqqE [Salinicola sp. LHM]|uniref:pyrroloquinoline quinone biosynthesis protein PqqE n=1 Tax=Salinicola sp. LHM TaxID=3065298 RepID=UPI002ACE4C0C|nr:pyrroloquinoline quinone biosynthesis protein PqqE [Salinicola sp. LHM]WQH33698.1 pyrroloquinoline quinone biosynthesis protein PqqE [Salinicola sp. LHM]
MNTPSEARQRPVSQPSGQPPPIGMLAELTHRCPLQCPYCSNPVELTRKREELDTETWQRVFAEAAELGVLQVHLSGGEPALRQDLETLVASCAEHGLYSNLITAGVNISRARLEALADAGLDHVQLSVQGATAKVNDHIANLPGAFDKKLAFAAEVTDVGLPLTLNSVIHRANLHQIPDLVELALALGARRLEIAHAQYYGWALQNRGALMPPREQVMEALELVEAARERLKGKLVIDAVVPDYYARLPKPCMNGWGRQSLNVSPLGKVLPCHAAETIPGLEFWNVRDHALGEIWQESPAFNAYRGTAWMPDACQSCDRREIDWGGCRCQALMLTGDATQMDPVCELSPYHDEIQTLAIVDSRRDDEFIYRRFSRQPA